MSKNKASHRLRILPFGFAVGLTWAIGIASLAWGAWLIPGWGDAMLQAVSSVYPFIDASFLGGMLGGLVAGVDGFIGGIVVAWLYNCLQ